MHRFRWVAASAALLGASIGVGVLPPAAATGSRAVAPPFDRAENEAYEAGNECSTAPSVVITCKATPAAAIEASVLANSFVVEGIPTDNWIDVRSKATLVKDIRLPALHLDRPRRVTIDVHVDKATVEYEGTGLGDSLILLSAELLHAGCGCDIAEGGGGGGRYISVVHAGHRSIKEDLRFGRVGEISARDAVSDVDLTLSFDTNTYPDKGLPASDAMLRVTAVGGASLASEYGHPISNPEGPARASGSIQATVSSVTIS